MPKPNRFLALAAILAAAGATPLAAQPNRTWVASNGVNGNPCTRLQPCATFVRALTQTTPNGIVSCADAGDFGGMTITGPVVIDCTGPGGAVLAVNTAILIDFPPNSPNFSVVLRGLEISGNGTSAQQSGIRLLDEGGSLTIENVIVRNFDGSGILITPTLATRLSVINTTVTDNGAAGIRVAPAGAGYANVTLEDVRLIGNGEAGLRVAVLAANSSSTNVVATRSSFIGSSQGVDVEALGGTRGATVTVRDSVVNGNLVNGLLATGVAANIIVSTTTIAGNSNGVATTSGGIVASFGNNQFIRNGTNGAFNGFLTGN